MNRYVDLGSPFADLDPTEAELAALADVMAELDERPPDYGPPGDGSEDDGPWHDQLGMAYELDPDAVELAGDLGEVAQLLDMASATDAQRLAEDAEPLPRRAEDRTAWLVDRLERGTYMQPAVFRDAELSNTDAPYGCGTIDEFGRCSARYHGGHCIETVRGSAATGNHEAASQFRDALMANTRTAVELATAHRYTEGVDDWLADPGPTDQPVYQAMRELLGLSGRQHRPEPVRPAVQITPAEIGIY